MGLRTASVVGAVVLTATAAAVSVVVAVPLPTGGISETGRAGSGVLVIGDDSSDAWTWRDCPEVMGLGS
ncbi:hypothetical protein Q0Z83_019490 [Actinoplanes sichuanensis]|uniref:Uncharacterized protein n=1 Tax=Actinoplanes sichuanensis TaxID=512349 RepID=A0ABW4AKP4_9ACTN|nr:hypothetical protein [Actinoplanes sichuanensis]BEL03758.1 hypothetical protein Q0Z83_019490 [Actinoplanes sichuanensis]